MLEINRNLFIQEYPLTKWRDDTGKAFKNIEDKYLERERLLRKDRLEIDRMILDVLRKDILKDEIKRKWEIFYDKEMAFNELTMHQQVTADFIAIFLEATKSSPIEDLEFFQNAINGALMIGLNLQNSKLERSAFSNSIIQETKFDGSTIINTVFTFSDLTRSSFVRCKRITASLFDQVLLRDASFSGTEFKDVFFAGSDLSEADFKGTKGLEPIYFYEAKNWDKAIFDADFKQRLDAELPKITEDEFKRYINSSELRYAQYRIKDLFKTLEELKSRRKGL